VCRMFDGILSDVIGRDGLVNETGNCNKNSNSGGGGDSCAERFSDHSTTPSTVGVFERRVTRYHNHLLRMRDPVIVTSSSKDTSQSVSFRQDVETPTAIDAPTSVRFSVVIAS